LRRVKRGTVDVADNAYTRRLLLALAFSIALHEIVAAVWPRAQTRRAEEPVVTQTIALTHRPPPTPAPTPRPTPVPTPPPTAKKTPAPRYTLAPKIVVRAPAAKAAATPRATHGGAAAPKHVTHVIPPPRIRRSAVAPSQIAGTHSGEQTGGTGTGAGAGEGTGGLGGTGSGTGTSSTGNGGDTNSAPCGIIYILPGELRYRPDGTVEQHVLAKVILRDGTVEVGKFPYPFIYPGDAANPFRHDAGLSKSGGIPVQIPPPDEDVSAMPPPVQVVLKHTNPGTGFTDLPECDVQPTP